MDTDDITEITTEPTPETWTDGDGVYFCAGGRNYGPYADENTAIAFHSVVVGQPPAPAPPDPTYDPSKVIASKRDEPLGEGVQPLTVHPTRLVELKVYPDEELDHLAHGQRLVFVNPAHVVVLAHHTRNGATCRVFTSSGSVAASSFLVMGSRDEVAWKLFGEME